MSEPQEWTIKSWDPWLDRETGDVITDNHKNHKGSVIFVESDGEAVDATFKPPVEIGQKKYGVVDFYKTRSGSMRKGFQRRDRPQDGSRSGAPSAARGPARDSAEIKAQFAIKTAVAILGPQEVPDLAGIEALANDIFPMIDRVKLGGQINRTLETSEVGEKPPASRPWNEVGKGHKPSVNEPPFDDAPPFTDDDIPFGG